MSVLLSAVATLGAIGAGSAAILYFVGRKFHVEEDPRIEEVQEALPSIEPEPKELPVSSDDPMCKVPKTLRDLMEPDNVTLEEIQDVVAKRGYYPAGTPFENYDPDFVQSVLIAAWPQVLEVIEDMRLPF